MADILSLSAEHYESIASTNLFWSELDSNLGQALSVHYGLNPAAERALAQPLNVGKKIELVQAISKQGGWPEQADQLVKELCFVGRNYKRDRNLLSHGVVLYMTQRRASAVQFGRQLSLLKFRPKA